MATTPLAFSPNGDGRADLLGLQVTLATAGRLELAVRTFEGATAVTLHNGMVTAGDSSFTWDGTAGGVRSPATATGGTGRDKPTVTAYGTFPDGPYIVVATANGASASLKIAIWRTQPVVLDPGRIVVTLDAGHGGTETGTSGRTPDGVLHLEKDADLDVGLKAGAMLRAAGYVVRYTRTTDVNRSLPQRTAYANAGRSDVLIGMHFNQISGARGRTEVFYCGRGCYGALPSRTLAQSVIDAHRARLAQYESDSFSLSPSPDHGWSAIDDYNRWFGNSDCTTIIGCHFGLLGPYSPTIRPKAATMPAILMESLAFTIGSVALANALAPGESVTVSVSVVPAVTGKRTWKVDLIVGGVRLSDRRLPQLLVHVLVH